MKITIVNQMPVKPKGIHSLLLILS
jgi:hypothetical protein